MLNIIKNQKSSYHICYNQYADETIRYAATFLQTYLYKATSCLIPLFSDRCEQRSKEILLGNFVRNIDYSSFLIDLGQEDFKIIELNDNLLFLSSSAKGILYAVYHFLELNINFHALTSEEIIFDYKNDITFSNPIIFHQSFEYRDCYFTDSFKTNFASINMLNSSLADLSQKYGGKTKWYNFHHSFSDLINPNEYFDTHPEYFSYIDGKRIKEHTELCLSNNDVFELVYEKLTSWIKENPTCKVFSVAQDEWMGHFTKMACECEECKKIDNLYQSQAASIILFVNKLAARLEHDYPDILIHTFAYQYSRKPPINLPVHKNVIVRLCNIECSWATSLEEGALKDNKSENYNFLNDLKGWKKLTNRLYIWDYAVNFKNYLLPFPNITSMAKNIKTYYKEGIKGILMQGNFSNGGKGSFDELKAFIASKLMKDPTQNTNYLIDLFCDNYYGKASQKIKEYIFTLENHIKNYNLWLYDFADASYFNDYLVAKLHNIMNEALVISSSDDTKYYNHVFKESLSQTYLEIVRMDDSPKKQDLINEFESNIRKIGITELFERTSLDYSIDVIKSSKFAKDRPNWYSLYYIMK